MKISVIIPSFNRAHTLSRAIDSVLEQSHPPSEIIVVNDGSNDHTIEFLSRYPQVSLISLQNNLGVSAARNIGIAAAKEEWIALLDSDDAWMPDKLSRQVRAAAENPEISIFHTDEIWIRNGKRVNAMKKHQKPDGWIYAASLALCCVSPSSILLNRKVLGVCGQFDESLPACEDYDLWLRLFSCYPVKLINEALVIKHGGHKDQLSSQYWGMDRFRIKALSKMLTSDYLSAQDRKLTLAMLQKKCAILSTGAAKRGKQEEAMYYQQLAKQHDCNGSF